MKNMGANPKDVAARALLEQSEDYIVTKITGTLAGMSDRTGQVKWQVEDARGRFAFLLAKFSREFEPEELAAMRERDAELCKLWDALQRAYEAAQEINAAVTARAQKARAARVK